MNRRLRRYLRKLLIVPLPTPSLLDFLAMIPAAIAFLLFLGIFPSLYLKCWFGCFCDVNYVVVTPQGGFLAADCQFNSKNFWDNEPLKFSGGSGPGLNMFGQNTQVNWWQAAVIPNLESAPPMRWTSAITAYRFRITVPVVPLALVLALPFIIRQLRRPIPPGQCQTCGYDMRATPDRCPECGAIPQGRKVVSV